MDLTFLARVRGGRLLLDEPVDLPDGTEVELAVAYRGDDLDDAERVKLHAALERSWQQAQAGEGRSGDEVIAELRARK